MIKLSQTIRIRLIRSDREKATQNRRKKMRATMMTTNRCGWVRLCVLEGTIHNPSLSSKIPSYLTVNLIVQESETPADKIHHGERTQRKRRR